MARIQQHQRQRLGMVKRGQIWITRLDLTVGSEIKKSRPALIISPPEINGTMRAVIVAPLTPHSYPAPFRIAVTFADIAGLILLDQMRTVDKQRLAKHVGELDDDTLKACLAVLTAMFAP